MIYDPKEINEVKGLKVIAAWDERTHPTSLEECVILQLENDTFVLYFKSGYTSPALNIEDFAISWGFDNSLKNRKPVWELKWTNNICSCDIDTLMICGCVCGAFKKEQTKTA